MLVSPAGSRWPRPQTPDPRPHTPDPFPGAALSAAPGRHDRAGRPGGRGCGGHWLCRALPPPPPPPPGAENGGAAASGLLRGAVSGCLPGAGPAGAGGALAAPGGEHGREDLPAIRRGGRAGELPHATEGGGASGAPRPGPERGSGAGPGREERGGPGGGRAAGGAAESRRPRLGFAVLPASSLPSNAIKCCRGKPLCRGELQVRQRPGSGWLLRRPGGEGKPLPAHLRQDLPAPRLLPLSKTPSELNFSPFCP